MAFKSINHDDEKIFYNRLWKLMEERNLSTARELAQALYAEEIVPVDSASEDEISIIGSMTRRIQEHLNLEGTDKLQGRYVKAYCDFLDVQQITCLAYLQLKVEIQMLLDSVKQQGYLKNRSEG